MCGPIRVLIENRSFAHTSDESFIAEMDHEKPEVVMPQIYEYGDGENTRSTLSPDFEFAHEPSIEPPNVEDRRERRGESLWWATFGLTV